MKAPRGFAVLAFVVPAWLAGCGGGGSDGAPNQLVQRIGMADYASLQLGDPRMAQRSAAAARIGRASRLQMRSTDADSETIPCEERLRSLIGLKPNGSTALVPLTTGEAPDAGLCEVLDVGDFLLASVTGMVDNGEPCPLVTIRRSNGDVACLRSPIPAQYHLWTMSTDALNAVSVSPDRKFVWLHTQVVEWKIVDGVEVAFANRAMIRLDFSGAVPVANEAFTVSTDQTYAGVIGEFLALPGGDVIINRRIATGGKPGVTEWWVTSGTGPSFALAAIPVGENAIPGYNPFYEFSVRLDGKVLARTSFVDGKFIQPGVPHAIDKPTATDTAATFVSLGTDFSLPPHGTRQDVSATLGDKFVETKRIGDVAFWSKSLGTTTARMMVTALTDGIDHPTALFDYGAPTSSDLPLYFTHDHAVYAPQYFQESGGQYGTSLPLTSVVAAAIDASGAVGVPFELIAASEGFVIKHITTADASDQALVTALNASGDTIFKISCLPKSIELPRCKVVYTTPNTPADLQRADFPLGVAGP